MKPTTKGVVDVVFCLDASGSMAPCIDAVRKNLIHLLNQDFEYVLILSGDQLYRMD